MASTTKMITALVVRESASLEDKVRVSPYAAGIPGGRLGLLAGEVFTVEDLLAALLLSSSNDAAVALAEHVSGDERTFVRRMNRMAASLGASDTNLANAHGLDAPGHVSSALDLALIGRRLLEDPVLKAIVGERKVTISSDQRDATIENTNLLLGNYVGAVGIKTGFTQGAGNVLVAAAEREGRSLIAVAMGSDDSFADATVLLERGFAEIERTILLRREIPIAEMISGTGESVMILTGGSLRGSEPVSLVTSTFVPLPGIDLPLTEGEVVGVVSVAATGAEIGTVPAVAGATVSPRDPGWVATALSGLLSIGGRLESAVGG